MPVLKTEAINSKTVCRHCGESIASKHNTPLIGQFCGRCSDERRRIAIALLPTEPITEEDREKDYIW